jgi:hypothetical protein
MDERNGLMVATMKDNILEVKNMEMELSNGLMEPSITVSGRIIRWMVLVNSNGQMEEFTLANMLTIRNMDMVLISGLMVDSMKEDFIMVNSMVKACTDKIMVRMFTVYGLEERKA